MGRKSRDHWIEIDRRIFLTEAELAVRWLHSQRSLQRWRASGNGPQALRIGRRVVYRVSEIEAFEARAGVEEADA